MQLSVIFTYICIIIIQLYKYSAFDESKQEYNQPKIKNMATKETDTEAILESICRDIEELYYLSG